MKQALLSLAVVALGTGYVFAQGSVTWGNQFGTTFYAPVYGGDPANPTLSLQGQSAIGKPVGSTVYGGPLLQGTGFTLGFYVANAGTTDPNAFTLVDTATFRTSSSGGLPAGLSSNIGGKTVTINGHDAGTSIAYQLRAWDNAGGVTWSTANSRGMSVIGTIATLAGTDANGNIFNPVQTTGITSFSLTYMIPEPNSMALAGLGAAAMMIFRRRK